MRVQFLVSGGEMNLLYSAKNLRRARKQVLHDDEVHADAAQAILPGTRSVVVAHGDEEGTVYFGRTSLPEPARWLWIGMPVPPHAARVHLYCCFVGNHLPGLLRNCEAIGHRHPVPMPLHEYRKDVCWFLGLVEKHLAAEPFVSASVLAALRAAAVKRYALRLAQSRKDSSLSVVVLALEMIVRSL